jgi:hypothetical protein
MSKPNQILERGGRVKANIIPRRSDHSMLSAAPTAGGL